MLRPPQESDFDPRTTAVYLRYRAVCRAGWRGVVWCEAGAYYIATDDIKPDWKSKHRISFEEFERTVTEAELALIPRRGVSSEHDTVTCGRVHAEVWTQKGGNKTYDTEKHRPAAEETAA